MTYGLRLIAVFSLIAVTAGLIPHKPATKKASRTITTQKKTLTTVIADDGDDDDEDNRATV